MVQRDGFWQAATDGKALDASEDGEEAADAAAAAARVTGQLWSHAKTASRRTTVC